MKTGKDFNSEGVNTMSVALHKTSMAYGPSHIVVTTDVLPLIDHLVKLNSNIKHEEAANRADRGAEMFFTTSQGLSVTSSDVNRY